MPPGEDLKSEELNDGILGYVTDLEQVLAVAECSSILDCWPNDWEAQKETNPRTLNHRISRPKDNKHFFANSKLALEAIANSSIFLFGQRCKQTSII